MMTDKEINNKITKIKEAMNSLFLTTDSFTEELPTLTNVYDVEFFSGVTKGCLVVNDLPYVFKCGLDGYSNNHHNNSSFTVYDSDTEYDDISEFNENAAFDELNIYEKFKSKGLDGLLAKTWRYDDTFICAEKVIPFCDISIPEPSYEIELTDEEADWEDKHAFVYSKTWTQKAIKKFGIDYLNKFIELAKEYGFIDDLHSGNYGFDKDGEPKVIDWGGNSILDELF